MTASLTYKNSSPFRRGRKTTFSWSVFGCVRLFGFGGSKKYSSDADFADPTDDSGTKVAKAPCVAVRSATSTTTLRGVKLSRSQIRIARYRILRRRANHRRQVGDICVIVTSYRSPRSGPRRLASIQRLQGTAPTLHLLLAPAAWLSGDGLLQKRSGPSATLKRRWLPRASAQGRQSPSRKRSG